MIKIILLFLSVTLVRLVRFYYILTDAQKHADFWHIWLVEWKINTAFQIVKYSLIILAIVGGAYWYKYWYEPKDIGCYSLDVVRGKAECLNGEVK